MAQKHLLRVQVPLQLDELRAIERFAAETGKTKADVGRELLLAGGLRKLVARQEKPRPQAAGESP